MSRAILVVEDNADNMKLVSWALEDAGYEFAGVGTAEKALALLEEEIFDLVLMDISLPGMDGKEATRRLRRDPRFAALPIIAVTAHATKEEEKAIRDCGVNAMATKPIDELDLLQTIETILREGQAVVKVLVVDDVYDNVKLLAAELEDQGYEVSAASNGRQALEAIAADRPDLVLLDVTMPEMDGIEVCRRLKTDDRLRTVPVILVTARDMDEDVVKGLDAGADDYVSKPFSGPVLAARVRAALRTKHLEDLLIEQAHIDPLTGLWNRRALRERLEQEWARWQRHGRPLSLVMVDVDHFKNVNDVHGHFVGDRLLQEIAATITRQCRHNDLPARYGGEEFAIVVPDAAASTAAHLAERCRWNIERIRLPVISATLTTTASFGVADSASLPSPAALLGQADAALYEAKRAGRNTIRLHDRQVPKTASPADEP